MSDWELLQEYCRNGSEEAFATLVNRHLDLVYSAALRQLRSPEAAQDVTQSVFADLAQSAHRLKPDTILPAWLYEVTRRTAIDLIRKESRRQSRENTLLEMTEMNPGSSDWTHIEPLVDEAMESLRPADRAALLLRYFQNKSLREVGQHLGLSEDGAATSWLARADRLRQAFQRSPERSIPEVQLLTQQDWLDASKEKLETDEDYRKAMGRVRNAAEDKVAGLVQPALEQYLKANNGAFPTDLAQLQDFLKTPLDPAILQRFGIFPADAVPNVRMGGDWIITQKTFVDPDYDTHFVIGPNGHGTTSYNQTPLDTLMPALQAFSAANGGQTPTDPSQLQPYITTADQKAALQNLRPSSATSTTH